MNLTPTITVGNRSLEIINIYNRFDVPKAEDIGQRTRKNLIITDHLHSLMAAIVSDLSHAFMT